MEMRRQKLQVAKALVPRKASAADELAWQLSFWHRRPTQSLAHKDMVFCSAWWLDDSERALDQESKAWHLGQTSDICDL